MTTQNTAALESLRAFALEHNEIAFAHLVTAALHGEEWAVERFAECLCQLNDWSIAPADPMVTKIVRDSVLQVIRATDTTRPDGLIARSTVAP